MIRNSSPYGQGEVPINVGTSINVPQINAPMGAANNITKYSNISGSSSSSHYGQHDYSNLMQHGLNMNQYPQYSRGFPFDIDSFQRLQSHNNNFHASTFANNLLPMNLHANNSPHDLDLMQYQFSKAIRKSSEYNDDISLRKNIPINIPQVQPKSMEKYDFSQGNTNTANHTTTYATEYNANKNYPPIDYEMPNHNVFFMRSQYHRSEENRRDLLMDLENVTIKSEYPHAKEEVDGNNEEIDRQNVEINTLNKEIEKQIKEIDNLNDKVDEQNEEIDIQMKDNDSINENDNTNSLDNSNDVEKLNKVDEVNEKSTNEFKVSELDLNKDTDSAQGTDVHTDNSCVTDGLPLEPEINVKVEKEDSDADKDKYINPFIRDTNGVLQECIELEKYVVLGPEDAEKIIKTKEQPHLGENQTAFHCLRCSLVFLNPKRYMIHIKWHTFSQRKDRKFLKKEEKKLVKMEMKRLKDENDVIEVKLCPCPECGQEFSSKRSLTNHRERVHNISQTECTICNKLFPNFKSLKQHVTVVHRVSEAYKCSTCPKTFKFARSLQKHEDTHLEKTHGCTQCDKKFGSVLLLGIHLKTHEKFLRGTTYHCSYCAKGFYDGYTLAAHERTHRNERPYSCHICSTSFGTTSGLKRHLKVSHSTSKPWQCDVCHRSFSTEAIRDRHEIRTHHDPAEMKYPCDECTNRYMTSKDLQKHCNKVHSKYKRRRRKQKNDDDE